jgi:putative ABC transport system permease protein
MTTGIPMSNDTIRTLDIAPEGFQFPKGKEYASTLASMVDEHYFETMAIPLISGRNFTRRDDENGPRVAIVNQHFAQHYWPNAAVVGKRFRVDKDWIEIIGVARTGKYIFIAEPPSDFVYIPYRQHPSPSMVLVAQTPGDAAGLSAPLRDVVHGLDVNMPVFGVRTMETLYKMRATSIFNVLVTTVGAMGLMGLALSIVGLYGLVAYAATRRTREIGIRMAIGATAPTVLRMVLQQGVSLAIIGLVVGLGAAVAAGDLMSAAFPTGDDQRDFLSLLMVAPVVLTVTLLATYIPARRASRVNPTDALRYE